MRNVFEIRNVWNCMKSMATLRWLLAGLLAAGLLAQSQQDSAKPETATELPRFVVPVEVVVALPLISLVIAVQANDRVESVLPQIQKIGVMIEPIVIGDQGEASVLAFDSRIRQMQDFTSDPAKITEALKRI